MIDTETITQRKKIKFVTARNLAHKRINTRNSKGYLLSSIRGYLKTKYF